MTFVPAIQSFVSPNTANMGTVANQPIVLDWPNARAYVYGPFAATDGFISRFVFSTGVDELPGTLAGTSYMPPVSKDPAGFLYSKFSTAGFTGMNANHASDFSHVGSFGIDAGSPPNAIPNPGSMVAGVAGGDTYWLFCLSDIPIGIEGHAVSVLQAGGTPGFAGHIFYMGQGAGHSWVQCPGPQGPDTCSSYTMETTGSGGGPQINLYQTTVNRLAVTYNPATWPIPNGFISSALVGSILPTALDPSYTTIACSGIVVDESDGNILANVSASSHSFIIKINSSTMAVMWKVELAELTGLPITDNNMGSGRVRFGRYAVCFCNVFLQKAWVINTVDGTFSTITSNLQGLSLTTHQCFNDELGCIVAPVTYAFGADTPLQIGNTPSSFTGWSALYVTDRINPPPIPGGRTSHVRTYVASRTIVS